MRIGAVNYLNSKPLIHGLEALAPESQITCDLPSRLADSLAAGRLDVALVPSIESFGNADFHVVSDACVACHGPVLSVKLHFRVPPARVERLALDEGSRTSAALAQILLQELSSVSPECEPLPIGCSLGDTDADAVLLIGDRAMVSDESTTTAAPRPIIEVWDLGERWTEWTSLPFVFAMWVARRDVDTTELARVLATARDQGALHVGEIAEREAPQLDIPVEVAVRYLQENLHFKLQTVELRGLERFAELCVARGWAATGPTFQAGILGALTG